MKINKTFSARHAWLHKFAIINDQLERIFRHHFILKRQFVKLYKKINLNREGYEKMPETIRIRLKEYYKEPNNKLEKLLQLKLPPEWY